MKIDLTFGVGYQAMAVLHFLKGLADGESDGVSWTTSPWYNGRECGVVLTVTRFGTGVKQSCHSIAWFEHRNSDQICCLEWDHGMGINPVSANMDEAIVQAYKGDNKWSVAASFKYGEVGKVADWIYKRFGEVLKPE